MLGSLLFLLLSLSWCCFGSAASDYVYNSNSFNTIWNGETLSSNINGVLSFEGAYYPFALFDTNGSCFLVTSVQFYMINTKYSDLMQFFIFDFQPYLTNTDYPPYPLEGTQQVYIWSDLVTYEYISQYQDYEYNVFLFTVVLPKPVDICALGSSVQGKGFFSVTAAPVPDDPNRPFAYNTFLWANTLHQTDPGLLYVYQSEAPFYPPFDPVGTGWFNYTQYFSTYGYGSLTPAFQFNTEPTLLPGTKTCLYDSYNYSSYYSNILSGSPVIDGQYAYNNSYYVLASFDTGSCFEVSYIQAYFYAPGPDPVLAFQTVESVTVTFLSQTTSFSTPPAVTPPFVPDPRNPNYLQQQVLSEFITFVQVNSTNYFLATIPIIEPVQICSLQSFRSGTGLLSINLKSSEPETYSYKWVFQDGESQPTDNAVWWWNNSAPWIDAANTLDLGGASPAFELLGSNFTGKSSGCPVDECYIEDNFQNRDSPSKPGNGSTPLEFTSSWMIPYRANPNFARRTGIGCINGCLLYHHQGKPMGLVIDKDATISVSFHKPTTQLSVTLSLYVDERSQGGVISFFSGNNRANPYWTQFVEKSMGIFPSINSPNGPVSITIEIPGTWNDYDYGWYDFTISAVSAPGAYLQVWLNGIRFQVC